MIGGDVFNRRGKSICGSTLVVGALFFGVMLSSGFSDSLAEEMLGIEPSQVKGYYHISVLGDPHLPGRDLAAKEAVVETINGWEDVDEVVCVGDLCDTIGTEAEFAVARKFISTITKPLELINGNHDYVFSKKLPGEWQFELGNPQERASKLRRFRDTFGPLSHDKVVTFATNDEEYSYHLIFLGIDSLTSPWFSCLSDSTLNWFNRALKKFPKMPTIVFCHSPLWGNIVMALNDELAHVTTQPLDDIREIVRENKCLFLWVAGHAHLGVNHPLAFGVLNNFSRRVFTVNNTDLDGHSILGGVDTTLEYHSNIWTKSLLLYPNKVVIKTYDHISKRWLDEKEQTKKFRIGKAGELEIEDDLPLYESKVLDGDLPLDETQVLDDYAPLDESRGY
jgi:hypothetical protein